MYAAVLGAGESIDYPIRPGRHAWVQVAAGEIEVNGVAIKEGDGLAVSDETSLRLRGAWRGVELLLFDLRLRLNPEARIRVPIASRGGIRKSTSRAYGRHQRARRLLLALRQRGTLALAAGLGAIQAGANIRLRRVADHADAKTIDATPAWQENLDRMNRDYVAPRPADPVWADVIILATPAESCAESNRTSRRCRRWARWPARSRRRSRRVTRNRR